MFSHRLETDRLILKGLTPIDFQIIFESLGKPQIMELLGHRSDEEYAKEEFKYKNGYATYNRTFILFLLNLKEGDKIIGRCGIHNWNKDHHRAEIGYSMEDENYRNQGLMAEAVQAILQYAYSQIELNRLDALVSEENSASIHLLKKFNFQPEAVLREHYFDNGMYKNSVLLAQLRSEYLDRQQTPIE